jgi:hypothetical protein
MWREPYLETCCRAAMHRLSLAGELGRPADLSDDPCLRRLIGLALVYRRPDGRYLLTPEGERRHRSEI